MLLENLLPLILLLTVVASEVKDTSQNALQVVRIRPRKRLTDAEIEKKYANLKGKIKNYKNTTKSIAQLKELANYENAILRKVKKKKGRGKSIKMSGRCFLLGCIVQAGQQVVGNIAQTGTQIAQGAVNAITQGVAGGGGGGGFGGGPIAGIISIVAKVVTAPIVLLTTIVGRIGLQIGRRAEEAKDISDSDQSFINKMLNDIYYDIKEQCNVVMFDAGHSYQFAPAVHIMYETVVEFRGRKYRIWLFESGRFQNKHFGINGWPNMGVIGNHRWLNDRTVEFSAALGCYYNFQKGGPQGPPPGKEAPAPPPPPPPSNCDSSGLCYVGR